MDLQDMLDGVIDGTGINRAQKEAALQKCMDDGGNFFLQELEYENPKRDHSSPKSAHYPGPLRYHNDLAVQSPKQEEKSGLWRSIFGYFRGPPGIDQDDCRHPSSKSKTAVNKEYDVESDKSQSAISEDHNDSVANASRHGHSKQLKIASSLYEEPQI
jgi:hypothetical protein